jgi:hypothetical protein
MVFTPHVATIGIGSGVFRTSIGKGDRIYVGAERYGLDIETGGGDKVRGINHGPVGDIHYSGVGGNMN